MDVLSGHRLASVEKMLQPEHVSLWLKPDSGKICDQAQT